MIHMKIRLTTTAERFIAHRLSIACWAQENGVAVGVHVQTLYQRVGLLFDSTDEAMAFQQHFEEL